MRYPADHKQQTRERIVRAASRRFRTSGPEGAGIGDLMKDLRLTHGGFYRHFSSKDDLFVAAFEDALEESQARARAAIGKAKPGQEARAIIDAYLDLDHCTDVAGGCPVAALAVEIPRRPRKARETILNALRRHADELLPYMPGETEDERRQNTVALLSAMSGTMIMARAFSDPNDKKWILEGAKRFLRRALGVR